MAVARAGLCLVIGAICGGAAAWRIERPQTVGRSGDETWALPEFEIHDVNALFIGSTSVDDQIVSLEGALMGDDVGWPVNTWNIRCLKSENGCEVAHVEEIGQRQLGAINLESWPVVRWDVAAVVLQSGGLTTDCSRVTITIVRREKTAHYLSEPVNAGTQFCRRARKRLGPARVEDWHIGNPKQPWD